MRRAWPCTRSFGLLLALLAAVSVGTPASAVGLDDFGFGRMNGRGQRRLLVILATYPGHPAFRLSRKEYDDLIFNFLRQQPSVNGYVLNNSSGRFLWTRAGEGIVGPLAMSTDDAGLRLEDRMLRVEAAAVRSGFNFGQFDANCDGQVTSEELGILIISLRTSPPAAARRGGSAGLRLRLTPRVCFSRGAGSQAAISCGVSQVEQNASFTTMVHELTHQLGAIDLYGAHCLNSRVSLMSCTGDGPLDSYHLDPWHKLQLGWSEPRIYSLRSSGSVLLPAANLARADAPAILYDPVRGPQEFFILEYRSRANSGGLVYDGQVSGNGLAIWHVLQDPAKQPVLIPDWSIGRIPAQLHWRWCKKCQGLFFAGNVLPTACPAGGGHDGGGSSVYALAWAPGGSGQTEWRWCQKCQGLFFAGNALRTVCPAGGAHDGSRSSNYSAYFRATSPGQAGWRWCSKCHGMFYAGSSAPTACPAGGGHDGSASSDYRLMQSHWAVFHEGAPHFIWGGGRLWQAGESTPSLRWLDGADTGIALRVRPFGAGASDIIVDWAPGGAELGSGQPNWRWCSKCQGLFFAGSATLGRCPAGGSHDGATSGNYSLTQNAPAAPGQSSWRWCQKCEGLFFGGNPSPGVCPAGGSHDGSRSGDYGLVTAPW
ncbi:MAG: hypothetical protein QN175_13845 [Armatimonadota bacterium]|nr:hypothetical protein [Armatimonadota bacterium]